MNKICKKKKKKSAKYLNFFIFYLDNLTVALCVKMSVCVYLSELLCAQLLGLLSVSFPTVAAWKPFNVHMFPSLELMIHVSNNVQITLDGSICASFCGTSVQLFPETRVPKEANRCVEISNPNHPTSHSTCFFFFVLALCHPGALFG